MREKYKNQIVCTEIEYEENKMKSFQITETTTSSFRVYEDGMAGIYVQTGEADDEEGFKKATENLQKQRNYPFEAETGVRYRTKLEKRFSDKELMDISRENMNYINEKYPQFVVSFSMSQQYVKKCVTNEKGMDYSHEDCAVHAEVSFKHKSSKNICDGYFSFDMRNYDSKVFEKMADDYLASYEKEVAFPEEIIIDQQYYRLLNNLLWHLDGEEMAINNSLLSGKIGEKVFSSDLTVIHDVSDKECWMNGFWDGDGCVLENDKLELIHEGIVVTGYSGKREALKYNIPHTKCASVDFGDIPKSGGLNGRIKRSAKTIKELLEGKCCVIPINVNIESFEDNGDYTLVVQKSLLFDGEKILGSLPAFTAQSNLFHIFGKDFIGVGSDDPIYHDKQMLYRVNIVNN